MIRLLNENDAIDYKQLRLYSLKTDPLSFLSSYNIESKYTFLFFRNKIINSTKKPIYGIYGYTINNKLIAYAQLSDAFYFNKRHIAYLNEIYVHPKYRKKKIATKIINHLIEKAKKIVTIEQLILKVNSKNKNAISLYEKLGFKKQAILKNSVKNFDGTYQDEIFYHFIL
jgi:ribosomal protein S18 acetylase RimI-like enzyme